MANPPQSGTKQIPTPVTPQVIPEVSSDADGLRIPPAPQTNLVMNGYTDVPAPAVSMNGSFPELLQQSERVAIPTHDTISADEIALYDRQIRLWGVQAQERLRNSNILLIGMKALGNEIAKNLVLAGVGALTILDHELVTEEDLCAQFFVSEDNIGQNRAEAALPQIQKLNPRVLLFSDPAPVTTKSAEYFSTFDITICTGLPFEISSTINVSCRVYNRKFYAADAHGMFGYVFSDLIAHDFVVEKERSNKATKVGDIESSTRSVISVTTKRENNKVMEVVTKRELYSTLILANSSPLPDSITKNRRSRLHVTPLLSCLRALFEFQKVCGGRLPSHSRADLEIFTKLAHEQHLDLQLPRETLRAEFLRSFLQNLGSELSPVVAFLGGHLAQDVINVLGQREQPLQNLLLFDGEEFKGPVYSMHPFFDDGLALTGMANGRGMMNMANGSTVIV